VRREHAGESAQVFRAEVNARARQIATAAENAAGAKKKYHPAEDRESQVGEKEGSKKRPDPGRVAFR